MHVRLLIPDDAERFQAIRLRALQEAPDAFASSFAEEANTSLKEVRQRLQESENPAAFLLGAFSSNNTLIGTLGFAQERMYKRQHISFIWGMYVASALQRQGIGTLLLTHAVTKARRIAGLEQIQLTVVQSNESAHQFYVSYGFEVFGEEKRALKIGTRYVDEDHMVFRL